MRRFVSDLFYAVFSDDEKANRELASWLIVFVQFTLLVVALLAFGDDDDGRGGRRKPLPDPTPSNDEPLRVPQEWLLVKK